MVDVVKDALREQIKEHEGYRLDVYKDTLGFDTGGYGHKIIPGEDGMSCLKRILLEHGMVWKISVLNITLIYQLKASVSYAR